MNKKEAVKFIESNIPLLVKDRNGKMQYPFKSVKAFKLIINKLSEALVKSNFVLAPVIKPFKCCKESDKCSVQCDDCHMVYNY